MRRRALPDFVEPLHALLPRDAGDWLIRPALEILLDVPADICIGAGTQLAEETIQDIVAEPKSLNNGEAA